MDFGLLLAQPRFHSAACFYRFGCTTARACIQGFLGSGLADEGCLEGIRFLLGDKHKDDGAFRSLALGANAGDVRKMVMKQGVILCSFGVLFGLGAAIALTRLMEALLYGVNPVDPVTFGAVAVSLTVVALLASYIPAARAAGIDPVEAIRWET